MKSIDIKKLINGFPTIKKVVYHSFLTILLGVTISVCSSVKEEKSDDSSAVASTGVDITDGSDQGYMRIGNMQVVWGKNGIPDTPFSFPKSFPSKPVVHFDCGGGTWNTTTMRNSYSNCNPYGFFAIGKWQ